PPAVTPMLSLTQRRILSCSVLSRPRRIPLISSAAMKSELAAIGRQNQIPNCSASLIAQRYPAFVFVQGGRSQPCAGLLPPHGTMFCLSQRTRGNRRARLRGDERSQTR